MTKDFNLESQKWLDLIFAKKNKQYGAYVLRRDSSNRHVKAFLIVAIIGMLAIFLPKIIKNMVPAPEVVNQDEAFSQTDFNTQNDTKQEQEEIIEIPTEIPPVLEVQSIMNTEAQIVADEKIQEENLMQAADALKDLDKVISNKTVEEGTNVMPGVDVTINEEIVEVVEDTKIYEWVQVKPSFPGGEEARLKWLNENINYPTAAAEAGIQGTVQVGFVVEKDGSISQVKILKGVHSMLDNEALRLVRGMPKWIPGKQNGNAVRAYFTQPIRFVLR